MNPREVLSHVWPEPTPGPRPQPELFRPVRREEAPRHLHVGYPLPEPLPCAPELESMGSYPAVPVTDEDRRRAEAIAQALRKRAERGPVNWPPVTQHPGEFRRFLRSFAPPLSGETPDQHPNQHPDQEAPTDEDS